MQSFGRFIRTLCSVPWLWSGVGLFFVGIGFLVWSMNADVHTVLAKFICKNHEFSHQVGFFHAINWSLVLPFLAPIAVTSALMMAHSFSTATLQLARDGMFRRKDDDAVASEAEIEHSVNLRFAAIAIILPLMMALTTWYAISYINEVSVQYLDGDPAYPFDNACAKTQDDEIDWSIANLVQTAPAEYSHLPTAEDRASAWGEDIKWFNWATSVYLIGFLAPIILSAYLFMLSTSAFFHEAQNRSGPYYLSLPEADDEELRFPVLDALRPHFNAVALLSLSSFLILYLLILWNDYLRSFDNEAMNTIADYIFYPFQTGWVEATAALEREKPSDFVTEFLQNPDMSGASFTTDRLISVGAGLVILGPVFGILAFYRSRKQAVLKHNPAARDAAGDVAFSSLIGIQGYVILLAIAIFSLFFVKFGVFVLAGFFVVYVASVQGGKLIQRIREGMDQTAG